MLERGTLLKGYKARVSDLHTVINSALDQTVCKLCRMYCKWLYGAGSTVRYFLAIVTPLERPACVWEGPCGHNLLMESLI